MDNGVPPVEDQVEDQAERRATPRSRNAGSNGGVPATGDRHKSPPRPRKPTNPPIDVATDLLVPAAVDGDVAVADRIDPLLAASSAALDEGEELRAAKPIRRRPAARQPVPLVAPMDDPATSKMSIVDDFFAEPTAELVAEPVKARVEVLVPYVLPKIVPGEPEAELELGSAPESESIRTKIAAAAARLPFKPQFRGVTKRLKRSLQPVVLPRHRPRVRRVTRVVRHIDTWSVFKIAVLFNIFLYTVCLTAGAMLWRVALNTGTIENVERFFESFGWQTFQLKGGEIYHNAWIIGLFGVVGLTGLAVLAATMFNLITDLVGGVRITVLEEEVVAREQRVVSWPRMLRPSTPPGGKPFHVSNDQPPAAEPPID